MKLRLRIEMPKVEEKSNLAEPLRRLCPMCGSPVHKWDSVEKAVKDPNINLIRTKRLRCKKCFRVFVIYPQGVTKRAQTERLRALSILLYTLGLSYDKVSKVLEALGCPLKKSTIWENVKGTGDAALRLKEKAREERVRVIGLDCTLSKVKGEKKLLDLTEKIIKKIIREEALEFEVHQCDNEDVGVLENWLKREYKAELTVTND